MTESSLGSGRPHSNPSVGVQLPPATRLATPAIASTASLIVRALK